MEFAGPADGGPWNGWMHLGYSINAFESYRLVYIKDNQIGFKIFMD